MKTDALNPIRPAVIQAPKGAPVAVSAEIDLASGFYVQVLKRTLDMVISLLLILLLLSWMLPVLLVLVCLDSRGPLFFVQKRIGYRGRVFSCIKIRSMRPLRDGELLLDDEVRITRIGYWLRLTHIDELPQLFNVLRNEMSLVGPRPHMLSHDARFSLLLPEYSQRQQVRPGITGLAQSEGFYGETTDYFSIAGRTRLDLFYIRKLSAGLDLAILGKTLLIVPQRIFNRFHADNDGRK